MDSSLQPGSPFTSLSSLTTTTSSVVSEDDRDITMDQCINETVANSRSIEQGSIVEKLVQVKIPMTIPRKRVLN